MISEVTDPVVVGKVSGVYGVKGWVKIFSHTQPRENILEYNPWWLKLGGTWQRFSVADGKQHGKGVIARFEDIIDRDQALALRNADIAISREQLDALAEGEYYWSDLIGLAVVNLEGIALGRIDSLFETGANDVIVVKGDGASGDEERLIPFVQPDVVKNVDLAAGVMTVDWGEDY